MSGPSTVELFTAAKRMNRAKSGPDEQARVDEFMGLVDRTPPGRLVAAAARITVWRLRRWWAS